MNPVAFTLYIHPHRAPNDPEGWRWAVYDGDHPDPLDLSKCINAGWAPTVTVADLDGQQVMYSLSRWAWMKGLPAGMCSELLPTDVIMENA